MAVSSAGTVQEICPICSTMQVDEDLLIEHSLGSHPVSRKSLQKALCAKRWRLQACGHFAFCPHAATISCEECKLAQYCSSQCMQEHKESHRKLCDSHLLRKATTPLYRKMDPKLLPGTPNKRSAHLPTLTSPAFPVCSLLGSQEDDHKRLFAYCADHTDDSFFSDIWPIPLACDHLPDHLHFLFPCAYDLRNVLQTVCHIPDDYKGRVTLFINSAKSVLAVRDLLILEFLRSYGSNGIDIATAVWYSTAVTPQQDRAILLAIRRILYHGNSLSDQDRDEGFMKQGGKITCRYQNSFPFSRRASFIKAFFSTNSTGILVSMLADLNARFEPSTQYWERDEEIDDIENVKKVCVLPAHLASWNRYHTRGILLPFDTLDEQFTVPNRVRYCRSLNFVTRYSNDVLCGWNIAKVISSGAKHGASEEDLYGCLYFHMREMMQTFLQKLTNCCIELCLTQSDTKKLAQILHQADIRFHRVDGIPLAHEYSIVDPNCSIKSMLKNGGMSAEDLHKLMKLLGLKNFDSMPKQDWMLSKIVHVLGRLLRENVSDSFPSRLLTVVLDWATKDPSASGFLQEEERKIKLGQEQLRVKTSDIFLQQLVGGGPGVYSAKIIPDHADAILSLLASYANPKALLEPKEREYLHNRYFLPYLQRQAALKEVKDLGLVVAAPLMILPKHTLTLSSFMSAFSCFAGPPSDTVVGDQRPHILDFSANHRLVQYYYTALFSGLTTLEQFQEWGWNSD